MKWLVVLTPTFFVVLLSVRATGQQVAVRPPQVTVTAQWENVSSEAIEGTDIARTLAFTGADGKPVTFQGTVSVRLSGSAADARIVQLVRSTTSVNGTKADVSLKLADDFDIQPARRFDIDIVPAPGLRVGAVSQHHVVIKDNDAVWKCSITGDSPLSFSVEITRAAATIKSRILSDGFGGLPSGTADLRITRMSGDRFAAAASFPIPAGDAGRPDAPLSLFHAPFSLALTLEADKARSGDVIQSDNIAGVATTNLHGVDGYDHLRRSESARFVLVRIP